MVPDKAILMVDDEAIILLSLRQELRSLLGGGFRYETARDAAQGLAAFEGLVEEGVRVVLVISDWLMPGMKGDEFLMRIRSSHPEVKTLMISGQTDEGRLVELRDSGSLDVFIRKPWSTDKLVSECRRLLGVETGDVPRQ